MFYRVRQDRYDKNYKQLNDIYGKVVYADLTRDDNKFVRDEYAESTSTTNKTDLRIRSFFAIRMLMQHMVYLDHSMRMSKSLKI